MAQTFRARDRMKLQREKLGDRKSEITILIDNDRIARLYPNINNQLRYQRKRQQSGGGNLQSQMVQPAPSQEYYQPPIKETEDIYAMLKEFTEKEEPEEEHQESDWFNVSFEFEWEKEQLGTSLFGTGTGLVISDAITY
ncbi:unnamed protein product [Sphagnum balticum]